MYSKLLAVIVTPNGVARILELPGHTTPGSFCTLVWFPDPSSGGEREGSGELPAACADLWYFNLMNLAFRT